LNEFSSVEYIDAKHEAQNSEAGHEFMEQASYVNPVTGKTSLVVIYGLDLDQVKFMEALRRKIESFGVCILMED
jgi:hypothetical protein